MRHTAALAAYYIDVNGLGLANGLHTTGWDVFDSQGNVAGIGSRFFTVRAGSVVAPESVTSARAMALGVARDLDASSKASRSVLVRAGRDDVPMTKVTLDCERALSGAVPGGQPHRTRPGREGGRRLSDRGR